MTLLLSHIPKTAGTSLRDLVGRKSPDATFVYDGELQLADPKIDFVAGFRRREPPSIVVGHFSYGAHRLLGLSPVYASVLREPVSRVISLYAYMRALPDSHRPAFFPADLTLETFVSEPLTELSNNHMCRMIAGIAPESGLTIDANWLLELALHNLNRHYVLVSTLDRIDAFVDCLARRLNWRDYALPHENRTDSHRIDVSERTRAMIKGRNALDIKLFEFVQSRGGLIARDHS